MGRANVHERVERSWFRRPRYRRLARWLPGWAMRRWIRKTYHHPVAAEVEGDFPDLGCGSGSCAALRGYFHGGLNVGMDLSKRSVQTAEHDAQRLGIPAHYVCGDAFRLPFRETSFDTVYIGQVLEHLHQERRVVSEAARVLRPGGKLIISVPIGERCGGAAAGHVNFYHTEDECRALVGEAPFEVEGLRPYHRHRWFLVARRKGTGEGDPEGSRRPLGRSAA